MEDYLKAIYRLAEVGGRVTTQSLAQRIGVAPASATNMLKRLAELKLVDYEPYRGVELTDLGLRIAKEMIRHHRLLELYLTEALGFEGDEVHAEAERLEHHISEKLEERIDQILGFPTVDPHGSPIPGIDGEISTSESLVTVALHQASVVTALPTGHPARMKELDELGIQVGSRIEVLGRPPRGKLHVRLEDRELLLEPQLCRCIHARAENSES